MCRYRPDSPFVVRAAMIEQRVLAHPSDVLVYSEVRHLCGWLVPGRLVSMLLGIALLALAPLAHASPPDPTWIAGLYDDADHDDAVIAITEVSASPTRSAASVVPAGMRHTPVALAGPTKFCKPSRISLLDRSPPLG